MREGHFSEAGKRHLREWIGGAEVSFADPDLAIERRVHLLRVTGKRLRAVLRLAALETGKKWPRRHAAAIQAAARELGPYRDAAVASALLEKRERKERSTRIKDLWQRWCAWRAAREGSPEIPPPLLLTRLLLTLQEAEERLARWLDRLVLEEGLQAGWDASVVDLRAGAEAFFASPDNPAAHLWRKRMKELWYQTEWLQAMAVAVPLAQTRPLDRISSALGRANDFAVLQEWLWETDDGPWEAEERLILDGHLETLKRKAWQRVSLSWKKVDAALDGPAEASADASSGSAAVPFSAPLRVVDPGPASDAREG